MARFSQYPAASSTDYVDETGILILAPDGSVKLGDLDGLKANYLCDIRCASLTIATADVLQLGTTPQLFGISVPSGYYAGVISADVFIDFNTTPYATNTDLEIGIVGSNTTVYTLDCLGASVSTIRPLLKYASTGSTDVPIVSASDIGVSVKTGDPTAGDSDITIYITFRLVQI